MKIGEVASKKQFAIKIKEKRLEVCRGDIFLINCKNIDCFGREKTIGIVLQNNKGNHFSPCTIVAFSIYNEELHKDELIFDIENITTVDKTRLLKKIGALPTSRMHLINQGVINSITGINNGIELLAI